MNTERLKSLRALVCVCCAVHFAAAEQVRIAPSEGDATTAIQTAIDRVWQQGGGRVSLSAGEYAVGGLRLRSNVELHLEANAILNGSRDCDAYAVLCRDRLEPVKADSKFSWFDSMIRICSATNVAITGESGSAIDGHNSYSPRGEERYRGAHGISASGSTNVVVRGVEIRHTGNWATCFFDCANLRFEDLTIRGGHDGVHVRGCDRVCVSRCDIRTGDDSVAGFDNNDVLVMDCSLNSACSAFRFGGTHVRVNGPCVRSWAGVPQLRFSGVKGVDQSTEKTDSEFSTPAI